MKITLQLLSCALLVGLLTMDTPASAQVRQASYSQPTYVPGVGPAQGPGQGERMTPAMRYFAGGRRVHTPRPVSRRPAALAQQSPGPIGKPFQHVDRDPNLSPYLNLDMVQTNEAIPNYYSRVVPQQQMQEASAKQKSELRRLRQELRMANVPGLDLGRRSASTPTTGSSQQFMNRGSYFPTNR